MPLEQKVGKECINLEPRYPRDQSAEGITARRARTDKFIAALDAMPMLDERSPREILDDLNEL